MQEWRRASGGRGDGSERPTNVILEHIPELLLSWLREKERQVDKTKADGSQPEKLRTHKLVRLSNLSIPDEVPALAERRPEQFEVKPALVPNLHEVCALLE